VLAGGRWPGGVEADAEAETEADGDPGDAVGGRVNGEGGGAEAWPAPSLEPERPEPPQLVSSSPAARPRAAAPRRRTLTAVTVVTADPGSASVRPRKECLA